MWVDPEVKNLIYLIAVLDNENFSIGFIDDCTWRKIKRDSCSVYMSALFPSCTTGNYLLWALGSHNVQTGEVDGEDWTALYYED